MNFFSSGVSVILILKCGIAVSSSPAVSGFSSFWLTATGKRRSFAVSVVELFSVLARQYLMVYDYTISDG